MEWAKKVQLVQSSATLKEFKTFVEREKDNFDSQAASMLINSVDIIENDFKENHLFYKLVIDIVSNFEENLDVRDCFRLELLRSFVREDSASINEHQ